MLDTGILIRAEKNNNSIDFGKWEAYGEVYISAITVTELLIGVHRADTQTRKIKRSTFVEAIIHAIPILDFTAESARTHAEIYAYLAKKGKLIGAHEKIAEQLDIMQLKTLC